jgi:hypothetical protein
VASYLDEDMSLEKALDKKRIYIVDLKLNEEIGLQNDLKVGQNSIASRV